MGTIHVDIANVAWNPGSAQYGPAALHEGKEIVQSTILSDRRRERRGVALLSKVSPPPGKIVKIVAIARSDEHVFNPEGGRATKSGQSTRAAADYTLNPEGQVHSVRIATETLSLVIYRGEPEEKLIVRGRGASASVGDASNADSGLLLNSGDLTAAACGLAAVSIWSSRHVVTRLAVITGLDGWDIAALRFGVAGLLLSPVILRRGFALDRSGSSGLAMLVAGLGAPYALVAAAALCVAPAYDSGALSPGSIPPFVALITVILQLEQLGTTRKIGLFLIAAGVLIILGASVDASSARWTTSRGFGDLLVLAAGFLSAGATVVMRRHYARGSPNFSSMPSKATSSRSSSSNDRTSENCTPSASPRKQNPGTHEMCRQLRICRWKCEFRWRPAPGMRILMWHVAARLAAVHGREWTEDQA